VINRQLQSRDQEDTILANQSDVTYRFDTFEVGHTLVGTVEYARESSKNYARNVQTNGVFVGAGGPTAPFADLNHPNANFDRLGPILRTGAYTQAEADSVAVALFDTVKLSEQWQVSGGLRWDYFDLDYRSVAPNGTLTAGTPLSRTDDMLSYRAGVVYKPRPNGSIYGAIGTSFNPSAEGLTLSTNAATNFDVDPEESLSYEIGTKWELSGILLNFAVFATDKFNARTEDPTDPTDVVALDGEQRVAGFEIGGAGNITDEWKVYGGYAYLYSEITKSKNELEEGRRVNNTPEHSISLWTTYAILPELEVGSGVQFVGSRLNPTAPPNTRRAPSYWLGDAMIAYHATKNLSLQLNVYNLTDEKYIDRVGGGHFVPGAGRSAALTATFKF
jgi:catecholate siderophore receptor